MKSSRIRFAPDILQRLGEELNPHPSFGIIELVKNSYDADARNCTVTLEGVDAPGGAVTVSDNGDGMTPDDIERGWLVIGKSQKRGKRRTRLKRIPAGSKGLGRLAALRLGRFATMVTRPRSMRNGEFRLLIDWDLFDKASLVDDVGLDVEQLTRKGKASGTTITLTDLRDRIGRIEVKRLARAMLLLADPFGADRRGFQPRLIAPEFADLEKLVEQRYFDSASYHLVASFDGNAAKAQLLDFQGNELRAASHETLFPNAEDQSLECPRVQFELWSFILNRTTFGSLGVTIGEVREWLAEFGGVHIYHNGIRVAPYGDPEHDWLSMNLSRVRSPEERPSTNNSIGRVRIEDEKEVLLQKTDRSGFIETHEFLEVRRFAQAALEWMASVRLGIAEQKRAKARAAAPKRALKSKAELEKIIDTVPPKIRGQLRDAAARYDRSRDREVEELRREVQLYRTLSTAGITAATFAHESTGNPLKVIAASIATIERRGKDRFGNDYGTRLAPPVDRIKGAVDSLGVLDAVTLSLLEHEKRRPSKVELHDVIKKVLTMFTPLLAGRNVKVETFLHGDPWVHSSRAAIESIVTNLVNNSLAALESVPQGKRKLVIRTSVQEAVATIAVQDSGEGIRDIRIDDIWLPGKTTRKSGTGLGLAIVRDTAIDMGGAVGAIQKCEIGGAEVYVEIPVQGA